MDVIGLEALRRMSLRWGRSAPIWGRYGHWKFDTLAHYGPVPIRAIWSKFADIAPLHLCYNMYGYGENRHSRNREMAFLSLGGFAHLGENHLGGR